MKHHHTQRGTTFTSVRHRPGHSPVVAEHKVPERSVEHSQRATSQGTLPSEFYGGGFKPSPEHEAEGRIGIGHHAPVERDRASASTAESEQVRREHDGRPLK